MTFIKKYLSLIFSQKSTDELLIIGLAISLFLPYTFTTIYLMGLSIFIILKRDLKTLLKKTNKGYFLLLTSLYLLMTSLIFKNYLGALISIALFLLFIVFLYYQTILTRPLFEQLIDIMIFMSIFSALYGIVEQLYYANYLDALISFFDISDNPKYRVHSFFSNANYYALMIIFIQLFCVHRLMYQDKHKIYYNSVAALNLFALFLTGSRFPWIVLIISLIILFIISKKWVAFIGTLGFSFLILVLTMLNIPLIPRLIENGIALGRRETIYEASLLMMKDTWLFGKGPLTYLFEHANYLEVYIKAYPNVVLAPIGISAPHSHSLLLEPFLSFGIIGSLLFIYYLVTHFAKVIDLHIAKVDRPLTNLIISATVVVVVSDIIDLPILWIQTGFLFFMIIGASSIYTKSED